MPNTKENISKIKAQRDRFVGFSFAAADLLLEIDENGNITFTTGAVKDLTGKGAGALLGTNWLDIFMPHDKKLVLNLMGKLGDGARISPIALRLKHGKTDEGSMVSFSACRLPGSDGLLYCTLSHLHSAAISEAMNKRRDVETGLIDKDSFNEAAEKMLEFSDDLQHDLSLTLMDLGNHEELSARLGQDKSAELMGEIGNFLRESAADNHTAGRLDDNKFGIMHDSSVSGDDIRKGIADISKEADPKGMGLKVAANDVPLANSGLTEKERNKALVYTINKYVTSETDEFDINNLNQGFKSMIDTTVERIAGIKETISTKKFDIVFQPIVDLKTNDTHHFEVLSRIEEGKSPQEWVEFTENIGMIEAFDLAVCQRVISYILTGEGAATNDSFGVNLSGQSIASTIFMQSLIKLLSHNKWMSQRLSFEVTESSEIDDLTAANNALQDLRKLGYKISLDDFGSGAASFQYLHAMEIDYVKIDGKYAKDILVSERDALMLKAMGSLCRDLNVGTVVERVETQEQADKMLELGMQYGQGWLFGKPEAIPKPTIPKKPKFSIVGKRRGSNDGWG